MHTFVHQVTFQGLLTGFIALMIIMLQYYGQGGQIKGDSCKERELRMLYSQSPPKYLLKEVLALRELISTSPHNLC